MFAARLMTAVVLAVVAKAGALEPLKIAPEEAEVVARLDVRAFMASPLKEEILTRSGKREQLLNGANVVRNLTDLDVFQDISEIWLFARIEDDGANIVMARGKFNQEKLLTVVGLNETYKQATIEGATVHTWMDDTHKHAIFLEDYLIIAGSEEAMRAMLKTRDGAHASFAGTAAGKRAATITAPPMFWGLMAGRDDTRGEFGRFSAAVDLSHVLLTGTADSQKLEMKLSAFPTDRASLGRYERLFDGSRALAELLSEEKRIAEIVASEVTHSIDDANGAAVLSASIDYPRLFEMINVIKSQ